MPPLNHPLEGIVKIGREVVFLWLIDYAAAVPLFWQMDIVGPVPVNPAAVVRILYYNALDAVIRSLQPFSGNGKFEGDLFVCFIAALDYRAIRVKNGEFLQLNSLNEYR